MGYYTGGNLTLTASGWGPANSGYEDCHKQIVATISLPDGSNTLSYSLTSSTTTSSKNPYARTVLYVRDNSNSDNDTNIINYYDSGYQNGSFPHTNTTISGTLDTKGFTQLKIDLYLYVSSSSILSDSDSGTISRTYQEDINYLTINYYSNYANTLYKKIPADTIQTITLDSTQNVFIHSDSFAYGEATSDFIRDYSGTNDDDRLEMVRTGWEATGYWNTSPDRTGIRIHEEPTDGLKTSQEVAAFFGYNLANGNVSVNLYPEWVKYYTVTFVNGYNGTILKTEKVEQGKSATPPSNPSRPGYTFTGWNGNYTNVTEDRVITATWTINTYIVTFVNGASVIKTEEVVYGGSATPPSTTLVKAGYTFVEWENNYTNITKDTTSRAIWRENILTINYYSNYANKLRKNTINTVEIITLDSTINTLIHTDTFYYTSGYRTDYFRNYSGEMDGSLLMRRNGYLPTSYWKSDKNIRIYESNSDLTNPIDIAEYFNYDLTNGDVTINLYAEWVPLTKIEILNDGTVYAGDYIVNSSSYIDKNGAKIYAPNFIEGNTVKWSQNGLVAKAFKYGSSDFPYSADI